jgi:hypothetical protein
MNLQAIIELETAGAVAGAQRLHDAIAGLKAEASGVGGPGLQSLLRTLERPARGRGGGNNGGDGGTADEAKKVNDELRKMGSMEGGRMVMSGSLRALKGDIGGVGDALYGLGRVVKGTELTMVGFAASFGAGLGKMLDDAFDISGKIGKLFGDMLTPPEDDGKAAALRAARIKRDFDDKVKIARAGIDPNAKSFTDEELARMQGMGLRADTFRKEGYEERLKARDPEAYLDRVRMEVVQLKKLHDERNQILDDSRKAAARTVQETALAAAGDDGAKKLSILSAAIRELAEARAELVGRTAINANLLGPDGAKDIERLKDVDSRLADLRRRASSIELGQSVFRGRLQDELDVLGGGGTKGSKEKELRLREMTRELMEQGGYSREEARGIAERREKFERGSEEPTQRIDTDRLARIGLFVGGGPAGIEHGRNTARNTERMARGIDQLVRMAGQPANNRAAVVAET